MNQPSQKEARAALWRAGVLRWKLDPLQQEIYDAFYQRAKRKFVICMSRRGGKTFLLCLLALEHAIRTPNAQIKYAAPTQKQVKRMIFPIFRQILRDCPADIKPEWFAQETLFEFPNGSTVAIAGMDGGRGDALRGTDSHFAVVDEAGFSTSEYLQELVSDILMPMCLRTDGKICIASTPPKTPRHAFELYFNEAATENAAIHKTIYDSPSIPQSKITEYIKEAGGEQSTTWRREYLAEFVIDEKLIAIPEFNRAKQLELVRAVARPAYFDAYVSMDVGYKDATGILFFYWDFKDARIVVEDEVLLHGVHEVRTDIIANAIKGHETDLWGNKKPYFRISDVEPLLINDLDKLHGLKFVATAKDSKEAGVNELRLLLASNRIYINPRCKQLIGQLESCIWDVKRDNFDRVPGYWHFDLVDALIYGVRGVRRNRNPYPAERYNSDTQFFTNQPENKTPSAKVIEQLFKPRGFGK